LQLRPFAQVEVVPPLAQLPEPLHVFAEVSVLPVQAAAAHCALAG
jgi:hypothetical protein